MVNTRHAVGDDDVGKARATRESPPANTRHTVRNRDGGKASATRESTIANTRHAVCLCFMGYARGNHDIARVFPIGHRRHLSLFIVFVQIIVQITHFNYSRCVPGSKCLQSHHAHEHGQNECKFKLFHNVVVLSCYCFFNCDFGCNGLLYRYIHYIGVQDFLENYLPIQKVNCSQSEYSSKLVANAVFDKTKT